MRVDIYKSSILGDSPSSLKEETSQNQAAIILSPEEHHVHEGKKKNGGSHSHVHNQTLSRAFLLPVFSLRNTFALPI